MVQLDDCLSVDERLTFESVKQFRSSSHYSLKKQLDRRSLQDVSCDVCVVMLYNMQLHHTHTIR